MGWRSLPDEEAPTLWRDQWVEMFKQEYFVRAGYKYDEQTDADLFFSHYGQTPHDAVLGLLSKYGMTDLTKGKKVWYVVTDEDGPGLVEDTPHEYEVLWVGTDKFTAEQVLCRHCVFDDEAEQED